MNNWQSYAWGLRGVAAQFLVDLDCADALTQLPKHDTLLYLTCLTRRPAGKDFSFWERRSLDSVFSYWDAPLVPKKHIR